MQEEVLIVFSKDGIKLDDRTLWEGSPYTYGKIFSTKIAWIRWMTNAEGVLAGAVRLDNFTLTPT